MPIYYVHPRLRAFGKFSEVLAEVAALAGRKAMNAFATRKTGKAYRVHRPGPATPIWCACAKLLAAELRTKNAKVLLARHLGIPKQRLTDFVVTRTRLPDAEIALQLVYWLAEKRAGRDPIRQSDAIESSGA